MTIYKKGFFFLTLLVVFTKLTAIAQPLLDTIYVNERASVSVRFPTLPDSYRKNPEKAPYDIATIAQIGFTVSTNLKNSPPADLYVTLGKRYLHFLIMYKKNLNYNEESDHDYTSYKKIDNLLEERENGQKNPVVKNADPVSPKAVDKKSAAANDANDYHSILENGYQKFKDQQYAEARMYYEKAHKMRPDDPIATDRLNLVKAKLEDKSKQESKEKQAYLNYIAAGQKSLKQNKLTEARISFEQALVILPNDKTATKGIESIEEKENQLKQTEDQENNYNTAFLAGDKALQKEDYQKAKAFYAQAHDILKNRPEPQEQLKNIDKIIAANAAKEQEANLTKTKKEASELKEKEAAELEKKYFTALRSADKLFANGDLIKARSAYNNVLQLSNRQWPKDQVVKIDKLLAEQDFKEKTAKQKEAIRIETERKEKERLALEIKYNNAIEIADNLFKAGKFEEAKPAYRSAIAIIKKPWPEDQLKTIARLEAEQAAAAKAEKLRIAQEKLITDKYNNAIAAADAEFGKNNYARAKTLYANAIALKSTENYPKQKLNEIQATQERIVAEEKARKERIAAEAELKKKYDIALSKAKSYYLKEDLVNAQAAYNEAVTLKPTELEPKAQLKIIKDKLAEIARLNEIEEKYQSKKDIADAFLIAKDYEKAIQSYRDALEIKKDETYPNSQIRYIQAEMKAAAREKEQNEKYEAQRKEIEQENKFRELISQADKSIQAKNYQAAKQQYAEALKIKPDHEYAKARMKIAGDQLEMSNKVYTEKAIAKNTEPVKKDTPATGNSNAKAATEVTDKASGSAYALQANPLPYTDEELKAKYPAIDFKLLPPEQPFNEEAVDSKENTRIFNQVLNDKPRLNITDKSNKIKLICQGIDFEDQAVYLKLVVQNNSKEDFLTGAMMLNWLRSSGSRIKLYPLYLYPAYLPVIKPGYEAVIIYVCKSYNIGDKDKLNFELSDRMNKIKLSLDFKGAVYNEESVR